MGHCVQFTVQKYVGISMAREDRKHFWEKPQLQVLNLPKGMIAAISITDTTQLSEGNGQQHVLGARPPLTSQHEVAHASLSHLEEL